MKNPSPPIESRQIVVAVPIAGRAMLRHQPRIPAKWHTPTAKGTNHANKANDHCSGSGRAFLNLGSGACRNSREELFAKAEVLLAKGEFPAALQFYAGAARADRANQEYMQHFAMVRRIVDLRSRLDTEKNPQQWEYMAKGLRAFYATELIYPELLKLDQEIHNRLNSADSAAMLAENPTGTGPEFRCRHNPLVGTEQGNRDDPGATGNLASAERKGRIGDADR